MVAPCADAAAAATDDDGVVESVYRQSRPAPAAQSTGKVRTRQPQREKERAERNCCPFTRSSLSAGTVQRSLSLLLFLDLFKFFISVASSLRKVDLKGAEGDRWMVGWMEGDADIFVRFRRA